MKERNFKGVWIPKEIWESRELTMIEKLFIVEIDSLDNDQGCYASNAHFANFFGITKSRCSQIINDLERKNWLKIDYKYEGRVVKKRTLTLSNKLNTLFKKFDEPIKNIKGGYLENAKENNTYINNTLNNITNKCVNAVQASHKAVDLKERFEEIWKDYPNKKGKSKAFSAYEKAIKKGVSHELVHSQVKAYAADVERKRTSMEYVAHGSTWFAQERWNDDYDNGNSKKPLTFGGDNHIQLTQRDYEAYKNLKQQGGGFE